MANRYQSIINGVVEDVAMQIDKLLEQVPVATWKAQDDKLVAVIDGEEYDMTFAPGDPLTEALLLLLNNKQFIISSLRSKT